MTAPGTPSTPGQGGAWRDTTRDGTLVRNVAWDGEAWTGEYQTEGGDWHGTYWYADGSFAPGGTPRGLDLIAATPTPAPLPAAEVDAVDRILRLIETEDFGPEYRRRTADRVALFDAIWQEHDRRPRADGYSERDSFYNGFLVGWAQGEKSLRQSLAALALATRTEGGAP